MGTSSPDPDTADAATELLELPDEEALERPDDDLAEVPTQPIALFELPPADA